MRVETPLVANDFRSPVSPEEYVAYLSALLEELELSGDIPDGIHELRNSRGNVALALSRPHQFVAAQFTLETGATEAFFVNPSAKSPQCGLRIRCAEPPAWHQDLLNTPLLPASTPNPTFLQLACMLASDGRATPAGEHLGQQQDLESEVDYLKTLLREQGDDLRRLKSALFESRSTEQRLTETPREESELPTDLADLAAWCVQSEDRIVVLSRARKGARKSTYEQPGHIFEALAFLAGPYCSLRRGELARKDYEELYLASGFTQSGSVGESVAGEQGDAYFVSWGGRRRFLETHLVRGGGREERYCMRVYFFWDEASRRVIVGDMPRHLDNSLT